METDIESITAAGILLVIWEAIIIIVYLFFSNPIAQVFAGFAGINIAQMPAYVATISTYFGYMFAIAGIVPIVVFIVWIYQVNPQWNFRRFQ